MAAHASAPVTPELDPGGVEGRIARRVPAFLIGAVGVLGIAWWMAAQPPPGPGWGDPNGPQQQWPQGQGPQPVPRPPPPPAPASACSGLDCGDCGDCSGLDCSGLDCSGLDISCAVSGANGANGANGTSAAPTGKSCSTHPLKRLAGSSVLLLPLFVLIGWRRRLRRAG